MIKKKTTIELDSSDLTILLLISQGESPTNIADSLAITAGGLSHRLKSLEQIKLLESKQSTGVKHVTIVYILTPAAIQVLKSMAVKILQLDNNKIYLC